MLRTWYITRLDIFSRCAKKIAYHLQVVKVDGRTIGDGKVGPVTKKLQASFKKLTEESGVPIQNYLETWKVCNIFLLALWTTFYTFPYRNIPDDFFKQNSSTAVGTKKFVKMAGVPILPILASLFFQSKIKMCITSSCTFRF